MDWSSKLLGGFRRQGTIDDRQINQWFSSAVAHHHAGRMSEAEKLYRRILATDPDHAQSLHRLGLVAMQAGKFEASADLITEAIAQDGTVVEFHNSLAQVLERMGRIDEASKAYLQAIRLAPVLEQADERNNSLRNSSPPSGSVEASRAAVSLRPDLPEVYVNLASALGQSGDQGEAEISCRRALILRPEFAEAEMTLGTVLRCKARPKEAMHCYKQVLSLHPEMVEAHLNLAGVLAEMGRLPEAFGQYRQTLALCPDYTEAWLGMAMVCRLQNNLEKAATYCRHALAIRPDEASALSFLAGLLHRMGAQSDAQRCVELCLRSHPRDAMARLQRLMLTLPVVPESADHAGAAVEDFDRALDDWTRCLQQPDVRMATVAVLGAAQPFYLAYRDGNHVGRLSRYGSVVVDLMMERWHPPTPHIQRLPERISLAVVSSHIRRHSVWDVLLHGFLTHLDRDRFKVTLLHLGPFRDEETKKAQDLVDHYHGDNLGFSGALTILTNERPDILFFPDIGMETVASKLAALRFSPLQATGLGQPITSGLPTIDLYFSGDLLESAQADTHYSERLVRLSGTGLCTESLPIPIEPYAQGQPPESTDLVDFALCQNPFKFDPIDDALYPKIARLVGACRFWVMYDPNKVQMTDRLIKRLEDTFTRSGLDPSQYLRPIPWLPRGQFLGFLETMDVYLDCPAFSGYTTAWQALGIGLPIVTREGSFLRQRLAAGLLRQIGCTDTIATSREDYVTIAVRIASECRDPAKRQARRETIKAVAPRANGNIAAVRGFEQTLIDELGRRCPNIC